MNVVGLPTSRCSLVRFSVMAQAAWQETESRVAVVVAHGIGNQMPMDTVRALVDNVFGEDSGEDPTTVYSRMDRDSGVLDLRRLMVTQTADRPRVDFYELYWQGTFGSGSPGAVVGWVLRLLLRRRHVGHQMRKIVRTVRIALVLLLVAAVAAADALASNDIGWDKGWKGFLVPALPIVAFLSSFLLALPRAFVVGLLSNVVADASRWFSPGPKDLENRDKVRRQAVGLLKDLHDARGKNGPRYGRIVVVAHSQGAVVTYDAIRLAFDQLRDPPQPAQSTAADPPVAPAATPSTSRDLAQPSAWQFCTDVPGEPPFTDQQGQPLLKLIGGAAYHEVQTTLHAEQRSLGVEWRVTDFITVGSPLTHARDLIPSKKVDLERRMAENEFPTCPPRGEQQNSEARNARKGKPIPLAAGRDGTGRLAIYRAEGEGPLIAHEASPFATTRWTNLYFPMKWWLGGDPVGGPVEGVFGRGIVDIEVEISAPRSTRRRVMAVPVMAHTWYWHRVVPGSENSGKDCVERLRTAMDLHWPSPG